MFDSLKLRFPGIRPFRSDESDIFFGRDSDIENVERIIFLEKIGVLHGKSGTGKSSLINAQLAPGVIEQGYTVIIERFGYFNPDHDQAESPIEKIINSFKRITPDQHDLTLNTLLSEDTLWWIVKNYQLLTGGNMIILIIHQNEAKY